MCSSLLYQNPAASHPIMAGLSASGGRKLQKSKESADLTIDCRGEEFRVHKLIVCNESDFIAACCNNDFKVSSHILPSVVPASPDAHKAPQERRNEKIELPEDEPEIVRLMIDYLYTGVYKVRAAPGTPSTKNIDPGDSHIPTEPAAEPDDADSDTHDSDILDLRDTFGQIYPRNPDNPVSSWADFTRIRNDIKMNWGTPSQRAIDRRSEHVLNQHMKLYTLADKMGTQRLIDATVDNIIEESKQAALRNKSFPAIARELLCGEPFKSNERLTHRLVRVCLEEVGFLLSDSENDLVKLLHEKAPTACHYFNKHHYLERELEAARVTKGWNVESLEMQEMRRRGRGMYPWPM